MSAEQLLEACDAALLRSKRAGKGRVELAAEGPVHPARGWHPAEGGAVQPTLPRDAGAVRAPPDETTPVPIGQRRRL